jgi:hypothetical protein
VPGEVRENDENYAKSPTLFLKFDRFGSVYYELSVGFAYSSLCGPLSPTGC